MIAGEVVEFVAELVVIGLAQFEADRKSAQRDIIGAVDSGDLGLMMIEVEMNAAVQRDVVAIDVGHFRHARSQRRVQFAPVMIVDLVEILGVVVLRDTDRVARRQRVGIVELEHVLAFVDVGFDLADRVCLLAADQNGIVVVVLQRVVGKGQSCIVAAFADQRDV